MTLDFTPAEQRTISAMVKAGRNPPEEFCAVAVMQALACLYIKLEPLLTEDQKAVLFGAGAYIGGQAHREMQAMVEAVFAINKARGS